MKNIIIMGQPGAGKTTLIRRLADIFKEFNPQGFITLEIRREEEVTGYAVSSLQGESRVLSHVSIKSKYAMGRFRIDMKGFETFLTTLFAPDKKSSLYFIDEIGKIECQSKKFCKLINELLNSDKPVVASMADKGSAFIQELKKRDDVRFVEISTENRNLLIKELTMDIRDLLLE